MDRDRRNHRALGLSTAFAIAFALAGGVPLASGSAQLPTQQTASQRSAKQVIAPGEKKCTSNNVCAENKSEPSANPGPMVYLHDYATTCTIIAKSGSIAKVTNADGGTHVLAMPNSVVDVEGTAGTVSMGSDAKATVTNKATAGGSNMYVVTNGGSTTVTVPPGSTVVVNT